MVAHVVARFGLHDGCGVGNERVPPERLIENRARLDVWQLHQAGALIAGTILLKTPDGTITQLTIRDADHGQEGYEGPIRVPEFYGGQARVEVAWEEPMPGCWQPWWCCPRCARRCRDIFLPEHACRKCLHLDYSSRHKNRSVPGIQRVQRWRRQLQLDPRPFSPLPARPARHIRFHRLAAMIRAEEARMLEHLQTVNRDLERRIVIRSKATGQWKS